MTNEEAIKILRLIKNSYKMSLFGMARGTGKSLTSLRIAFEKVEALNMAIKALEVNK